MPGANGLWRELWTTRRGRIAIAGRFTTAGTGVPTSQVGDCKGVTTRTGVGVFNVTLPKKFSECEALNVTLSNEATDDKIVCRYNYAPATGIIDITVIDASTVAATETTGMIVHIQGTFNSRST